MNSTKEILINKTIFIHIINNSVIHGSLQSSQLQSLNLLLELQIPHSPGSSKELLLQVTDELNPLLLLSSNITEGVYQNLKTSQGLLVDFNSFPLHFSDLVKKCIEEQQNDSPKFILVLRSTGSEITSTNEGIVGKISLEVIELNSFKHLCHFSLNLTTASIQTKLTHLSSYIKSLKNSHVVEKEKYNQENSFLLTEVESLRETLSAKTREVDVIKNDMQRKISSETEKLSAMLMQEKDNNLKAKSDFDRRLAREKRESEIKFNEKLGELKFENSSFKKKNAEVNSKNECLENALRETKMKLREIEEKSKRQVRELSNLAKERGDWQRDFQLKQDCIRKLKIQIAHQERDIQERERDKNNYSKHLASLKEEKAALVEKLTACEKKLEKRENSIQHLFIEFQKSLDVVQQFKNKLKTEENQNLLLLESIKNQEKSLQKKEEQLKKTTEEREELTKKIPQCETELEEIQKKLKEANERIREQQELLKSNENVISWLNKQLHEFESFEAVIKKAPLTEAYLLPPNPGNKSSPPLASNLNLAMTSSTPLSAINPSPPNFSGSVQSRLHSVNDMPKIPEEINSRVLNNKENSGGLDPRYLEPTKKKPNSFPARGILRANSVNKFEELKSQPKGPSKWNGPKTAAKKSAYFPKS